MLMNSLCLHAGLGIYIGMENDLCTYCLNEYIAKNKCTSSEARLALFLRLSGEKVLKIKFHGHTFIICKEHIQKIHEFMSEEKKEEINNQKETANKTEDTKEKKVLKEKKVGRPRKEKENIEDIDLSLENLGEIIENNIKKEST